MFVEDLTAFFDADGFGDDASYQPAAGGAAVPLVAIILRPTVRSAIGQFGADLPSQRALVAVADLPAGCPAENDTLTIAAGENAGTYTVQTFGQDSSGRVVTLDLSEAT